jgi:hypothetical protein
MKNQFIIEDSNLDAIESLLSMSIKGIHQLFNHADIAEILKKPTEEIDFFNFQNMDKIQDLFLELIQKKTFEEKKVFLDGLSKENYEIVLRAYFHIVENTAKATHDFKH